MVTKMNRSNFLQQEKRRTKCSSIKRLKTVSRGEWSAYLQTTLSCNCHVRTMLCCTRTHTLQRNTHYNQKQTKKLDFQDNKLLNLESGENSQTWREEREEKKKQARQDQTMMISLLCTFLLLPKHWRKMCFSENTAANAE